MCIRIKDFINKFFSRKEKPKIETEPLEDLLEKVRIFHMKTVIIPQMELMERKNRLRKLKAKKNKWIY